MDDNNSDEDEKDGGDSGLSVPRLKFRAGCSREAVYMF